MPEAANLLWQRGQFDREPVLLQRQVGEQFADQRLVFDNQHALAFAFRGAAEYVQRAAAQELESCQHAEGLIDVLEQETQNAAQAPERLHRESAPDAGAVSEIAALIKAAQMPVIVVGDDVERGGAVFALVRLAERIGAPVWFEAGRDCRCNE